MIDARGKTIMPGMLDPLREVNIGGAAPRLDTPPPAAVSGRRGAQFRAEVDRPRAAFTRVADNFYPYESSYRTLLRSGLTGVNLVTDGYGQAAVVRVTPDRPDSMLVNADGVLFTAVTSETSSLDIIRTGLETAEKAKKGLPVDLSPGSPPSTEASPPPAPRARQGRRRSGGRRGFGGGAAPGTEAATLKLWQAVYEGKAPLFANAANAAAIVHLLKVVEPYKDVKLVLAATRPGPVRNARPSQGTASTRAHPPGPQLETEHTRPHRCCPTAP